MVGRDLLQHGELPLDGLETHLDTDEEHDQALNRQQNPAGLRRNLEQDQVLLVDREEGAKDHVIQTAS